MTANEGGSVPRRLRIEDLHQIAVPSDPALSPDGSRVVYVLRTSDEESDRNFSSLWLLSLASGETRQISRGAADSSPAWSPDGSQVAFLRADDDAAQLWLLPVDGGEAEQLTRMPLGAGRPVWHPAGDRIAFGAPVDLDAHGAAETEEERTRRRSRPIVADRLDYQEDGQGYLRAVRRHVHVLDLADRAVRRLTDGDWNTGSPQWSPGGDALAFPGRGGADTDLTLHAGAYVLDVAASEPVAKPVGSQDGYVEHVTWTADGRALLTLTPIGSPSRQAHLFLASMDGREHRDLTRSLDRNVMPGGPAYPGGLPQALGDGSVLFCARDRGDTHLYVVDPASGEIRPVVSEPGTTVSGLSAGPGGGTAVLVVSTPGSYGEIASVDLASGELTVHTRHGAPLADVEHLTATECEFKISDGTVVHGWLLRDPDVSGPQPLLLDVHGGPHNAWSAAANAECLYHQVLAARGWAVLLLNPRGSDGYGSDFFTASFGAWGTSDARDLLEPIDQLVAEGIADPSRLGVAGYSYGGYMSCYLTSRDIRFAAAVTGGVISDLTSMAGTSDAGHLLRVHELGVEPWSDPARLAEMSPLTHIDRVRTPTLVLQGEADTRCPVGQAQQWHTALRERGVPARLVLYPEGSHMFPIDGPPSHRLDYNRRIVAWLEEHTNLAHRDG